MNATLYYVEAADLDPTEVGGIGGPAAYVPDWGKGDVIELPDGMGSYRVAGIRRRFTGGLAHAPRQVIYYLERLDS